MSRIGRKPIPLPAGVKIAMQGGKIDVQGPKGKLSFAIPYGITFEQKDNVLTAVRATEDHRALHVRLRRNGSAQAWRGRNGHLRKSRRERIRTRDERIADAHLTPSSR